MEVATELVKLLGPPFLRHLGYLFHYKRNVGELKKEMVELGKVRTDVQMLVEVDQTRGRVIKEAVKSWLDRVDALQCEVLKLYEELEANKGCLACNVHYRMGKESKSKIKKVKNLRGEGGFDAVSIPPPPPLGIEFMETLDFQLYAPTKSAMEQIMKTLMEDKKLNLIGVYGMGGVGKTTLVLETAKQLKDKGVFDRVVVATVSQNCILTKIQREIAEKLGLTLEVVNESARASHLLERLKKEKRILIVLDDLWEPLELTKVGIPYIHGGRLDGKGNDGRECRCTIIITTRSQEVCNQMRTQSNVEVKVLPEADAWKLFRRSAGGRVDSPELYSVAWEVVRGCGGLPVALVTIGRSLGDKDLQRWQDAASQLKMSAVSPSTIPGMEERVFKSIKLSYDYLKDKNKSGVRMHDIVRDVAIWIASQEEHGFVVKARRGLDQWPDLKKTTSKCKRLSLMENGIRRLPKQMPSCPHLTTLSLRAREYQEGLLQDIPSGCFEGMKSLKVLDLNFNEIPSIPSSTFSWLKELRVLLLYRIGVEDISLFGNVKNLEILGLHYCYNLKTLPQEMIMGRMTNLKSLNLSGSRRLKIPRGVVSRLSHLEELYLLDSFNGWEAEDGPNTGAARLSELASLSRLSILEIEVPGIQLLINSGAAIGSNLSRFCIWLGRNPVIIPCDYILRERKSNRRMACYDIAPPFLNEWVGKFLERTEQLDIRDYRGAEKSIYPGYLIGESGGGGGKSTGLNNLRFLRVHSVLDVEYFLSSVDRVEQVIPFKRLEELELFYLFQLKKIYHGRPSLKGSLENLRVLIVKMCRVLNPILPLNIARGLQQLEHMTIRYCESVEEIISGQEEDNHEQEHKSRLTIGEMMVVLPVLPNLKRLQIHGCDRLKHICPMSVVAAQGFFSQLEHLEINECSTLEELFAFDTTTTTTTTTGANESSNNSVLVFPRLRDLQLRYLPNFSTVCRGASALRMNYSFPVCERLLIFKCPKLKRLPLLSLESSARLSSIRVEETWFDQLEWNDPSEKRRFLQRVEVQFGDWFSE